MELKPIDTENENNKLALIEPDELSLLEENIMNAHQLDFILKKTPAKYLHKRPAKGGGEWTYVTGGYIRKCLNLMFGWNWDFEILDEKILEGEVIVKGRLTCRSGDKTVTKMQYGSKEIIYRKTYKEGEVARPLSIGNDMKAAATDCLKKCAAELGIAADIYNAQDFKEVRVNTEEIELEDLTELYELKKENGAEFTQQETDNIERVINPANPEKKSFTKIHKLLQSK